MAKRETGIDGLPWLKDYPNQVNWDAPLHEGTVPQFWHQSVTQFADNEFCDFLNKRYSYGQMGVLVRKAAKGLQAEGVTKGTRVGLFLPNCPYYPIFYYAILSIGGTVVNFNPTYPDNIVRQLVELAEVEVMVTLDLQAIFSLCLLYTSDAADE